MASYILGIDPGVTGAYAVLSKKNKNIKVCKLFTDFETALQDLSPYLGKVQACIEKVHAMPNQGSVSTGTFMRNAGGWEGFLAALEVPREYVSPHVWPKHVLDVQPPKRSVGGVSDLKTLRKIQADNRKTKKTHTVSFVIRSLPQAKKYFKLKKDQDKADAICIALYFRRVLGYKD